MIFKIDNISKNYRKRNILNGVTLDIASGECVGLLGANGSGKSTLLSILAGVRGCDCGSFLLDGNIISDKHIVGYVPQGTPLFDELSVRDNLMLWYSKSELKSSLEDGVLKLLEIDQFMDVRVSRLSGGMKKKLSIACSVAGRPSILLLDEPCAALDLPTRKSIGEYIDGFKKGGGAVLLATHDISELSWCDRLYILKDGVAVNYEYDGDAERLAEALK